MSMPKSCCTPCEAPTARSPRSSRARETSRRGSRPRQPAVRPRTSSGWRWRTRRWGWRCSDSMGSWITVNSALPRITEHQQLDFERLSMLEIVHPDDRDDVASTMRAMVEGTLADLRVGDPPDDSQRRLGLGRAQHDAGARREWRPELLRSAGGRHLRPDPGPGEAGPARRHRSADRPARTASSSTTGSSTRWRAVGVKAPMSAWSSSISTTSRALTTCSATMQETRCCGRSPPACLLPCATVTPRSDSVVTSSSCSCEQNVELADLQALADRLLAELCRPYDLAWGQASLSCSFGLTVGSGPDADDVAPPSRCRDVSLEAAGTFPDQRLRPGRAGRRAA